MKVLKKIRNVFAVILLTIFLLFIVAISTLLLSRNDYGITQFKDKALIIIDDKISNNNYKEGQLVIVEEKDIEELHVGDEVFVYSSNQKTKKVEVIVSTISTINNEDKYNPSVTLENDKGTWGIEFVAGTTYKTYDKLGHMLSIIQSKWIFFVVLIVPCFFVLLYEVYLLVVLIKYDDGLDDEELEDSKPASKEEPPKEEKVETKSEEKTEEKVEDKPVEKEEDKIEETKDTEEKEPVKEEKEEKTSESKEDKDKKEEPKQKDNKDKKEENKEDKSVNYDELAKKIAASDSSNEEIEKQLLELKEKMMKEKEEKEKKAKQEKIDSLLKEISDLKDELDK